MKKIFNFILLLICYGAATQSQAIIINIDAYDPNQPNPVKVGVTLDAGTYDVSAIGIADGGQYNAWNAWGSVSGCDNNGANCSTGWLNNYTFSSAEIGQVTRANGRWQTDMLALANSIDSVFTLTSSAVVEFWIADFPHYDNLGGMSLEVTLINTSVPEPSIIALMVAGLAGIGFTRRRKQA